MKLLNYIKNIWIQNKHLPLSQNDIVWAKRYKNEKERQLLPKGHREGPYIIIRKTKRKIYALCCGGNKSANSNPLFKQKLEKEKYNFIKDGYVYAAKIIKLDDNRIIRKIGTLNSEDISTIYKTIYLINKRYTKVKHFPQRKLEFNIDAGDIVTYKGKLSYIYDSDNDFYYAKHVTEVKKGKKALQINDKKYSFDFTSKIEIPKNSKLELSNFVDSDMQKYIMTQTQKSYTIKPNNLERGKLIFADNNYYYIYGEYQNELLVYKVYLDNEYIEGMYKINIKKGHYYTLFEEYKLKKSPEIKIVRSALEKEMEEIKTLKKEKKTKSQNKTIPKNCMYKDFKPGYIMIETGTLDRYIIIERHGNKIIYALLDDINLCYEHDFESNQIFQFEISEKMNAFKFKKLLEKFNEDESDIV